MPKVSVVIPTFNSSNLVKEAVESVLAQNYSDFEIIVVDDGSTDGTRSVIEAVGDSRVGYFYKENGGLASARNFGVDKAAGDFVAFLDCDDLWPPDYLAVMTDALQRATDYGVAYCTVTQIYPDGKRVESYRIKDCVSGWITKQLFNKSFIFCQAAVFRKSALSGIYWDQALRTSSDNDTVLRISTKTKFLFVDKVQAIRRMRKDSLTARTTGTISSAVNCNKIRVLERFYRINGDKYFSKKQAMHRIGYVYRETAKRYYDFGARKAPIYLLKKSLSYDPFNIKAYRDLVKVLLRSKNSDTMPDWQMPAPLS